jgi:hypothetical protein
VLHLDNRPDFLPQRSQRPQRILGTRKSLRTLKLSVSSVISVVKILLAIFTTSLLADTSSLFEAEKQRGALTGMVVGKVSAVLEPQIMAYGVDNAGNLLKKETVFPLDELSDLYMNLVTISLVADAKLAWDERLRTIDSSFITNYPYITRETTVLDLLSWRAGGEDKLWRVSAHRSQELANWFKRQMEVDFQQNWSELISTYITRPYNLKKLESRQEGGEWSEWATVEDLLTTLKVIIQRLKAAEGVDGKVLLQPQVEARELPLGNQIFPGEGRFRSMCLLGQLLEIDGDRFLGLRSVQQERTLLALCLLNKGIGVVVAVEGKDTSAAERLAQALLKGETLK